MATREEKNKEMQKEIENDELREKRKKIVILFFKIIVITTFLFMGFYFYTVYISTGSLIVKEERLVESGLPDPFHGVKIIHFSDIHYGSTTTIESVRSVVKQINKRNPDIVIFSGDLVDKKTELDTQKSEELIKELSKIKASIGKYAVSGDEDDEQFQTMMKQSEFILLDNRSDLIYNGEKQPILMVGVSSSSKDRDIAKAFLEQKKDENNKLYTVLIMHEADSIDDVLKDYHVNMAFAGSSLNGQICLTSNYCFVKREGSKKYFKEEYNVNGTKLFVSSGAGTPPEEVRFMARPSINFFRLATQ